MATNYPIMLQGCAHFFIGLVSDIQTFDIHKKVCSQTAALSYPVVLLGVPLRTEGVERLAPLGAVGELEEAGECAPVLSCVGEDGVLEVDPVG